MENEGLLFLNLLDKLIRKTIVQFGTSVTLLTLNLELYGFVKSTEV